MQLTAVDIQQQRQKLHRQYVDQARRVQAARQHPDLLSRVFLLRIEARTRLIEEERKFANLGLELLAASGVELEGQGQL